MQQSSYQLLDSGDGWKLERFDSVTLKRPCAQAVWAPQFPQRWKGVNASFSREEGLEWHGRRKLPEQWTVQFYDLILKLQATDFGHLGVFPEHIENCNWARKVIRKASSLSSKPPRILNLFAYSGAATLAVAKEKAEVCHVDASKGMVQWARENAQLNQLNNAPIRWIVDDVMKFLQREKRRGRAYEGILLDPPSFGRGAKGEIFKIERELPLLLNLCRDLLSDQALFMVLSCHTPGFTPLVLSQMLSQNLEKRKGRVEKGELVLPAKTPQFSVPNGCYARWIYE